MNVRRGRASRARKGLKRTRQWSSSRRKTSRCRRGASRHHVRTFCCDANLLIDAPAVLHGILWDESHGKEFRKGHFAWSTWSSSHHFAFFFWYTMELMASRRRKPSRHRRPRRKSSSRRRGASKRSTRRRRYRAAASSEGADTLSNVRDAPEPTPIDDALEFCSTNRKTLVDPVVDLGDAIYEEISIVGNDRRTYTMYRIDESAVRSISTTVTLPVHAIFFNDVLLKMVMGTYGVINKNDMVDDADKPPYSIYSMQGGVYVYGFHLNEDQGTGPAKKPTGFVGSMRQKAKDAYYRVYPPSLTRAEIRGRMGR